jgi:hypothetical protein
MSDFSSFAKIAASSFAEITKRDVFVAGVDGDALYALYLASFPPGTDPVFKKRTEHDCSCCRQFIRRAGAAVSIKGNGELATVWDEAVERAPYPYDVVSKALRDKVKSAAIVDIFRVSQKEASFGADKTRSSTLDGDVVEWRHFYTGDIPSRLRSKTPDTDRGNYRTSAQVFERALTELRPDAIDTMVELIANGLYRGAEFREQVKAFQRTQKAYLSISDVSKRSSFVWSKASDLSVSRFRNTAIGTLAVDLSNGDDITEAAHKFGAKMDPTNYKRTSAVITPSMVKKAMAEISALGLEPALERRFARIDDINVNDVLWVDSSVRPLMKGGLHDALLAHAGKSRAPESDAKRALEISADDFVKSVLPKSTSVEVLLKNEHLANFVSLTAPVHPEPKQLFRWTNDFAWSYDGNVTDSIKERVKKAGGNVANAKLRVSLSWHNYDDLDLHVIEPSGNRIFFNSKVSSYSGGTLDVDMNAGMGRTREPVENIAWAKAPPDGVYRVIVNNYSRRETSNVGFVVEIECAGRVLHFSHDKSVPTGQNVDVATLHMKGGGISKIEPGPAVTISDIPQEKWGLRTEEYAKVSAVTYSPNYWGQNQVGNRHTFFFLEQAKNGEPTRGIYNEFLHPRLEVHRKVFEVIGDKTKCAPTEGQLSGLGFSSTKKASVVLRVAMGDKKSALYDVQFGGVLVDAGVGET